MTLTLQPRSLYRWCAGGLIAFFSLVQALRALLALPGRATSLGGLAITALAALTVAGMVGLLRARLRIERELIAMRHEPAGGALIGARRDRLTRIAALGGRPDADALAEAASAGERGRAYLGRWLVAVAVLIGLVGTFSGLAEALRGLPTIFNGVADPQRLAELMRGAMSGLELTFAAGIVGILATLALALVQGDLQLHEEQALARLEEITAHELVPALWPAAERPEVIAARELSALRHEAVAMRAAVGETAAALGATIAAELGRATGALRLQQADSLRAFAEAVAQAGNGVSERLLALHEQLGARAAESQAGFAARLEAAHAAITTRADQAHALLQTRADEAHALLQTHADKTHALLEARAERTYALLEARASETSTLLTQRAQAAETALAARVQAIQAALGAAAAEQVRAHGEGWRALRDELVPSIADARAALDAGVLSTVSTLEQLGADTARGLAESAATLTETAAAELAQARAAVEAAAERHGAALEAAAERQSAALEAAATRQSAALEVTLASLSDGAINAFASPAAQLGEAAATLAQAQQTLAPQLEALAPELRALTTEVALLGSRRVETEDEQPLFAGELVRLGEGVARLEALVQLAQQGERPGAQG
jgi:hypothetical protein